MSRLYYLDEDDIRTLVESLTRDLFPGTPAFQLAGDAGRGRLLSALAQPQWPNHRTAQTKAAVLHHAINKGHPYVDGNKRLALTAMLSFLYINDFEMIATDSELKQFALGVAEDWLSREESARFIRDRAPRLSWSEERTQRWVDRLDASNYIATLAVAESSESIVAAKLPDLIRSQLADDS